MGNEIQATGYVQGQAGYVKSAGLGNFANHGVTAGIKLTSENGNHLSTDFTIGTSIGGKVEVGHTFDIGKNMGLDLSANARYRKSLAGDNNTVRLTTNTNIAHQVEEMTGITQSYSDVNMNWKSSSLSFGASAKVSKQFGAVKLSAGIEGGAYKANKPELTYNSTSKATLNNQQINNEHKYTQEASKLKGYFTPTFGAEVGKGRVKGFVDLSGIEQTAGVRITLGKK